MEKKIDKLLLYPTNYVAWLNRGMKRFYLFNLVVVSDVFRVDQNVVLALPDSARIMNLKATDWMFHTVRICYV